MAIGYVGADIDEASSGAASQTINTVTIPAGTPNGSTAVVFLVANEPTNGLVVPSGMTVVQGVVTTTGVGTAMESRCWTKPVGSADAGTTLTFTDGVNGSRKSIAALVVLSGADSLSKGAGAALTGQSGSRTTPQLTGAANGCGLVELVADRVASNTGDWQISSGMTQAGAQSNTDSLLAAAVAYKLGVSGNVGAHTYTKTVTAPQAHVWSVAIAPSAVAGTGKLVIQTLIDGAWQ